MIPGAKEGRKGLKNCKGTMDKGVLASFLVLLVMGLVVLYAASFYNAQDKSGGAFSEVLSQLQGIALGAAALVVLSRLDYRIFQNPRIYLGLLALSLILLTLVAIPGVGKMINGSRRWLRLGPVSFQPSELAKYAMILFMANALSSPRRDVKKMLNGWMPLFVVPGLMFLLILKQPNLSTAGSIVIVAVVMVMLAGARPLHLGLMGVLGAVVGAAYAWSEPYRRARLLSFTDPFAKLSNEGYQLAQSLLAFGSGGWFGMGLGMGRQKYAFLPYPESDFIFAVVGEDLGFVGCIAVILMFFVFIFFGLRVAMRCPDRFGSLLAGGITAMIGIQCVMNMMVVIGLMPTTGLPLPLFSAGGTSVSIIMAAAGILLSVSRRSDRPI